MRELAVAVMVVAVVGLVAVAPVSNATHETSGCEVSSTEAQDIDADDDGDVDYWVDQQELGTQAVHVYQESNGQDGLQVGGHGPAPGNAVPADDGSVVGTAADQANFAIYSEPAENGYCGHDSDTLII